MKIKNIKKDLTGQIFGKLKVVKFLKKHTNGIAIWECLCECGNSTNVRSDLLTSGKTKSCSCLRKLPEGEGAKNTLYARYKKQAKERNLIFDLSIDDFTSLTKGICYYCGLEPQQIAGNKSFNGIYRYNGIDRLDNKIGYTKDNVVSCCGGCNHAKSDMDYEDFKKVIKRTYINLYKKVTDKTPGELIDSLITVDIKCFIFQDKMMDQNLPESERLKIAEIILELNKKRNKLMRSIDTLLDFAEDMVTPKTYLPNSTEDDKPEF